MLYAFLALAVPCLASPSFDSSYAQAQVVLASKTLSAPKFQGGKSEAPGTKTLTCHFTEPFFSLHYEMGSGRLTRVDPVETSARVLGEGLKLVPTGIDPFMPRFELSLDNKPLLDLAMDFQGSDGMSDMRFPISAVFHGPYTLHGGCETDVIKAFNPYSSK